MPYMDLICIENCMSILDMSEFLHQNLLKIMADVVSDWVWQAHFIQTSGMMRFFFSNDPSKLGPNWIFEQEPVLPYFSSEFSVNG